MQRNTVQACAYHPAAMEPRRPVGLKKWLRRPPGQRLPDAGAPPDDLTGVSSFRKKRQK
jgi:hypothetical protein